MYHTYPDFMADYLDLTRLHLEIAPDDTLRATIADDRCGRNVEVLRAFPLSSPDEHIVLRDGAGKELGVIEKLSDVPEAHRVLLEEALNRQYFLPRILKINSLYERFGSAIWDVETDRGPVKINSKSMIDSLTELGKGRYMLRDTEDNRYEIREVEQMDEASRQMFAGKF